VGAAPFTSAAPFAGTGSGTRRSRSTAVEQPARISHARTAVCRHWI